MFRELLNDVVTTAHDAVTTDTTTDHSAHSAECIPPSHDFGKPWEENFANVCLWFCFALSIGILIFYAFEQWRATCGWEEVYVCVIELIVVALEIFKGHAAPATIYQTNGNRTLWLRYAEWLLTCPVILIHLSNITGMHEEYTKRTMTLLVTDIGTLVFGATAALTKGPVKVLFFFIGLTYGCITFFNAAKVYQESFFMVPAGMCRELVKYMCWLYFISWCMFPILFVAGPEGFGIISQYGSVIGHTVADILSKNLWGLVGHYLRYKIHEYILIHGDIRRKVHHDILGQDEEIEEFVEEEDNQTYKTASAQLANRSSFVKVRNQMQRRGIATRASMDGSNYTMPGKNGPAGMQNGVIVVGMVDASVLPFWQEQFGQLPAQFQLVPALGMDNIINAVRQNLQAANNGNSNANPLDFVLLAPDLLQNTSSDGLVAILKNRFGCKVVAFGWAPFGPSRKIIEASKVDAWLDGPTFGTPFNFDKFTDIILQMQAPMDDDLAAGGGMAVNMGAMQGNNMGGMGANNFGGGGLIGANNFNSNPTFGGTQQFGSGNAQYGNNRAAYGGNQQQMGGGQQSQFGGGNQQPHMMTQQMYGGAQQFGGNNDDGSNMYGGGSPVFGGGGSSPRGNNAQSFNLASQNSSAINQPLNLARSSSLYGPSSSGQF